MGDNSALLFSALGCCGSGDDRCREILASRERAEDIVTESVLKLDRRVVACQQTRRVVAPTLALLSPQITLKPNLVCPKSYNPSVLCGPLLVKRNSIGSGWRYSGP